MADKIVRQARFSDERLTVTFGPEVDRREHDDEPSEQPFHIVYINGWDAGMAYHVQGSSGCFDVEAYLTRTAQPYAQQVLRAAERRFKTRNVSVEYYD